MQANQLTGTLPPAIGYCITLLNLQFPDNFLTGTLPINYTNNLIHLHSIFYSDNFLTGTIPSNVNNLITIFEFYFDGNLLSGTIPSTITELLFCRQLFLNANHFTGSIPSTIGNLISLTELMLFSNELTGSIPLSFTEMSYLVKAYFFYNQLTGKLPENFTQVMINLVELQIDFNFLTGTIPHGINQLKSLTKLYLGDNLLTGSIPERLCTGDSIIQISINNNAITGSIPSTLFEINSTKYLNALYFSDNQLTNSLPNTIEYALELEALIVTNNYLTGTIPIGISNMSKLLEFALGYNYFSGTIGNMLHTNNKTKLTFIEIENNMLEGCINDLYDTSYQHRLAVVDISNNYFTGKLTDNLFAKTKLFFFAASTNCITGSLPMTICTDQGETLSALILDGIHSSSNCQVKLFPSSLFHIHTYALRHPNSGTLPGCLLSSEYMKVLTTLHLSGIGLEGEINLLNSGKNSGSYDVDPLPSNLVDLTLSHNRLRGNIPITLQNHNSWQSLDLSFNLFSGEISNNISIAIGYHDDSENVYRKTTTTTTTTTTATDYEVVMTTPIHQDKISTTDDDHINSSNHTSSNKNISSSLSLQLNRLSGLIPKQLLSLHDIDILSGNMFACPTTTAYSVHSQDNDNYLPQHDKDHKSYECGSSSVNVALYLFLSIIGSIVLFVIVVGITVRFELWRYYCVKSKPLAENRESEHDIDKTMTLRSRLHMLWQEFYLITVEKEGDTESTKQKHQHYRWQWIQLSMSEVQAYVSMSSDIRTWILITSSVIAILLMPIYIGFGYDVVTSMYTHRYAWQLSAAFLTGLSPSVVLCVLLTFFALILSSEYAGHLPLTRLQIHDTIENDERKEVLEEDEGRIGEKKRTKASIKYWTLLVMLLLNTIVVLGINMLYVYAILQPLQVSTKALISLALSLFKIGWNWISTRVLDGKYLLVSPTISVAIDKEIDPLGIEEKASSQANESLSTFVKLTRSLQNYWIVFTTPTVIEDTKQSIWLGKCRIWVSLFNNIVVPCIAVTCINPDCFYYMLVTPPEVSTTLSIEYCQSYNVAFGNLYCYHKGIKQMTTTYIPPFVYNYQCSSALLVNFAAVLILRYLLGSLLMPLLKVVTEEWTRRNRQTNSINNRDSVKQILVKYFNQEERIKITRSIASYPVYSIFLVTDIAILLTFGVIFPPLAVVGAVCICCHVSCLRWNLCKTVLQVQGHILQIATDDSSSDTSINTSAWSSLLETWWGNVNLACHASIRIVQEGYWTMLWIVPIFWSGYLFDMLGDAMGYVRGVSMIVVMFIVSIALYKRNMWKSKKTELKEDGVEKDRKESVLYDQQRRNSRWSSIIGVSSVLFAGGDRLKSNDGGVKGGIDGTDAFWHSADAIELQGPSRSVDVVSNSIDGMGSHIVVSPLTAKK